jgi:hypothetical protein
MCFLLGLAREKVEGDRDGGAHLSNGEEVEGDGDGGTRLGSGEERRCGGGSAVWGEMGNRDGDAGETRGTSQEGILVFLCNNKVFSFYFSHWIQTG